MGSFPSAGLGRTVGAGAPFLAALAVLLAVTSGDMSAQAGTRRVEVLSLGDRERLWQVGKGNRELSNPGRLTAFDSLVVITDPTEPSVTVLNGRTGAELWKYDRQGSGPFELQQPVMASWHPSGILVADNRNRRVLLFSRDGIPTKEVQVPGGMFAAGLCGLGDGSILLHFPDPVGSGLVQFDFAGTVVPIAPVLPSEGLSLSELSIDLAPASDVYPGWCLVTRRIADGMAFMAPGGKVVQARYVERLEQRPLVPPPQIRDTSQLPIQFAIRGTVSGRSAVVRFGGKTDCAFRCLDVYSIPDLKYERSWRLQASGGLRIRDIVFAAGLAYVLGTVDDEPVIAAFRVPPGVP